jgi:magnesium transporter
VIILAKAQFRKEEGLNLEILTYDSLTWIDIEPPTVKERDYLSQNFPFHPLDLDDTLSRIQRPKIDEYKDYLFFVFNFPRYNKREQMLGYSQVSVFIGQGYLITLHKGDLKPLAKLFRECQENEEKQEEYLTKGPGYLLYRILDRLVDYCIPMLNKLGDGIEDVEDYVFSTHKRGTVREISRLRRDIIAFRRTIWPMRAVINSLEPRARRFASQDLSVYFGDLVDHLDKIWDGLDEYKEIIEGLHATHDSLASNRVNDILRLLTILTAIGTVLTVIVGFYGMNIWIPGGVQTDGNPMSWVILLIVMLVVSMAMIWYFWRKNWL